MGLFSNLSDQNAAKAVIRHETERNKSVEPTEPLDKSPVGQALDARRAGRTVFQIDLELNKTSGYKTRFRENSGKQVPEIADGAGLIQEIEACGWRLEHAAYVYRMTGAITNDASLWNREHETMVGQIVGIYIFRANGPQHSMIQPT